MNMEEMTFFAIIYKISVMVIIAGADFDAAAEIEVKAAIAYLEGNCGGIYAVSVSWYSSENR
jgi:hypothetical protein